MFEAIGLRLSQIWQELLRGLQITLIDDNRGVWLLQGLLTTLQLAAVAVVIGLVIGLLVALVKVYAEGSQNPLLRFLARIGTMYTTVVRGTPVMVQLLILYNLKAMPNGLIAGFIGFGLNSGAYVSEILRAGITSIEIGQMEAGRSLGLSKNQTMRFVILPQAVKNVLPAMFNEFIALVKETSIGGYIAVTDLTKVADNIRGRTFNSTSLYLAALVYLMITAILAFIQKRVERRLARSDRR